MHTQIGIPNVKKETLRHGGSDSTAVRAMNQALNKIREDEMRTSLFMIELGEYSDFKNFSTKGVLIQGKDPDDPSKILKQTTGSIEDLHDSYHAYTGGFIRSPSQIVKIGHMSCVPVAAFDPVFWIHHA